MSDTDDARSLALESVRIMAMRRGYGRPEVWYECDGQAFTAQAALDGRLLKATDPKCARAIVALRAVVQSLPRKEAA